MDASELLHLSRGGEFDECLGGDVEIIEEYADVQRFHTRCNNCGGEMYEQDAGDFPTLMDGTIRHFTYYLILHCMDCSDEAAYPMYMWRWKAIPQGPRYRPELQDNSRPDFWSPRASDCLVTSERVYSETGRFFGHNKIQLRVRSIWPSLTARETEDLLDTLTSYREEPDKWGGIHEINDTLTIVIRAEGMFFRVGGVATKWIDDKELDRLIDRIEWTTCHCCERKMRRVPMLKLQERRQAEARSWEGD